MTSHGQPEQSAVTWTTAKCTPIRTSHGLTAGTGNQEVPNVAFQAPTWLGYRSESQSGVSRPCRLIMPITPGWPNVPDPPLQAGLGFTSLRHIRKYGLSTTTRFSFSTCPGSRPCWFVVCIPTSLLAPFDFLIYLLSRDTHPALDPAPFQASPSRPHIDEPKRQTQQPRSSFCPLVQPVPQSASPTGSLGCSPDLFRHAPAPDEQTLER
jgi:hypothetical protein